MAVKLVEVTAELKVANSVYERVLKSAIWSVPVMDLK